MNLKVKNYKNINNLDLEIEEEKVNYIFGISGSGKSSIASAVVGDKSEKNISYGKKEQDMELILSPSLKSDDYLIFNEYTHQKLILDKQNNEEVYSILFENDNSLETIRTDIAVLLSSINSKRQELFNYVQNVEQMIKIINKRKLPSSGKFSTSSSIEKLKSESENPKYNHYTNFIHNHGLSYVQWIETGTHFEEFENGKCPFCIRKMSEYRVDKISDIINIKPEQYSIISDSQDILNKIGDVPNFSYKREISKLEKDLYDAINNKNIIEELYMMVDSYNLDTLDIGAIHKVSFSKSLSELFPDAKQIIDDFNSNLIELKKKLGNIKQKTSKLIGKNLKKLNDYLSKFSIPYEFEIDKYNTSTKTATILLVSKKEKNHEDRTDNLSYGEKNIISLLLFLVSSKKKMYNDKYVTDDKWILPDEEDYKYSINWIMAILVGGFFLYSLFFSGMMLARRQIEFLFLFTISPIIFATSVGNKERRSAVFQQLVSLILQGAVIMLIITLTALIMQQINDTTFFTNTFKDILIKTILYIGCGSFLLTGSQVVNRFIGENVSANSGREQLMAMMGFGQSMGAVASVGGLATAGAGLLGAGATLKGASVASSAGNSAMQKIGNALSSFGSKIGGNIGDAGTPTISGIGGNLQAIGSVMSASAYRRAHPIDSSGKSTMNSSQKLSRFASNMMSAGTSSIGSAVNTVLPTGMGRHRRR